MIGSQALVAGSSMLLWWLVMANQAACGGQQLIRAYPDVNGVSGSGRANCNMGLLNWGLQQQGGHYTAWCWDDGQ